MWSKLLKYLAIIAICLSILVPTIYINEKATLFLGKFTLSLAILSICIALLSMILIRIGRRKNKKTIYIAATNIQDPLAMGLKAAIRRIGWTAYPEYSLLLQGSKIKNKDVITQVTLSDCLVLLLSREPLDLTYAHTIFKEFKKRNKSILVFSNNDKIPIPEYLKDDYLIIQLPQSHKEAIKLIINIIEMDFPTRKSTKKINNESNC